MIFNYSSPISSDSSVSSGDEVLPVRSQDESDDDDECAMDDGQRAKRARHTGSNTVATEQLLDAMQNEVRVGCLCWRCL
jgi:hypothetical protein